MIDDLIWIPIMRFSRLTGESMFKILSKCFTGQICFKTSEDGSEYLINIADLPASMADQYIKDCQSGKIGKEEMLETERLRNEMNAIIYAMLQPWERKFVDYWLPILLETQGFVGNELKKYCESKGWTYSRILHHRKKLNQSCGLIYSIIPLRGKNRTNLNDRFLKPLAFQYPSFIYPFFIRSSSNN